jgi:hypothetical protein
MVDEVDDEKCREQYRNIEEIPIDLNSVEDIPIDIKIPHNKPT